MIPIILIAISLLTFIVVSAYNRDGDITIAFSKGLLFGFVWDGEEYEDGATGYTVQAALGIIILTLYYER